MVHCEQLALRAHRRAPLTVSSSHEILVPEKYGSSSSPVLRVNFGSSPSSELLAHRGGLVCHTIALWIGLPGLVPHDHGLALISDADRRDVLRRQLRLAQRGADLETTLFQMSSGSCSTQPESEMLGELLRPVATIF